MHRLETHPTFVKNVQIGGQNKVVIQTMGTIPPKEKEKALEEIIACANAGAELFRMSVLDELDAKAFAFLSANSPIPLIADIHFDFKLAILTMENGASKIRINPGNIGGLDAINEIIETAKKYGVPIRIGVNSGSLKKKASLENPITANDLIKECAEMVKIFEDRQFHDIVLSLKGSNIMETIEAYRLASKTFPYPLHIGITEAGIKEVGLIRSAAGLSPLLLDGIGDTIRISLSESPVEEVKACKRLLHDLNLYDNYPTFISCPTCGRTEVNLIPMAHRVSDFLETIHKPIKVAIMGCIVNGPGEARGVHLGLAGGKKHWALFKDGKVIATLNEDEAFERLKKEIIDYKI